MIWNALSELLVEADPIADPMVTFSGELDKYLMTNKVQGRGEGASFDGSMMRQSSTSVSLRFRL